jgi:hypothetical protein
MPDTFPDEPVEPPGMIGTPPSARSPIPDDPKDHAKQFAHTYADRFERDARERMRELGISEHEIGASDWEHGIAKRAFFPHEVHGGGNVPGKRLSLDSGILNPGLNAEAIGVEASALWAKSRLRTRRDAALAHEYEEAAAGGDHGEAVRNAPYTKLPISDEARHLLRVIAEGEKRQEGQ